VFGVYGYFIDFQQRHDMFTSIHDATQPSLTNVFIAGVAAGSVTRFLIDYLVAAVVMS
jgi:uncharacterized membrane protein YwzB